MPATGDPLFGRMWHLGLLGDIASVWTQYSGAGVHVAIYDNGVQYSHPDLAANYDASREFTYKGIRYDPAPRMPDDSHGTAVAGIIASARGNGLGGSGVAFGAQLTAVNYLDDILTRPRAVYEAATRHAASFDIMSNSWSSVPRYRAENSLNVAGGEAYRDNLLFGEVTATGRGGLGTVIVQAAGNESANANGDGLNASRFTLTVAATDATGAATYYSNYGANVLVAAPAAAVTTDLTGTAGYNGGGGGFDADYTAGFGGTSASAAVATGVAALMLQANPGLGWRDVNTILAMSAAHTGSAFGSTGSGSEVGRWQSLGDSHWNGGGSLFHLSYGYGRVDAHAAVRMAEAWAVMQPTAHVSANEVTVVQDYTGPAVAIHDLSAATLASTVATDIKIDTVYVTVEVVHSYAWDLDISLVAPDGKALSLFLGGEGGGTGGADAAVFLSGPRWTFAVEALRGVSSAGTWTLRVEDKAAGDTGLIKDFDLSFFGAPASADDIYHFTDRFQSVAAVETARHDIADGDGGVDWLDLSAVTGNVAVRMGAGGLIRVDGVLWADLSPAEAQFENLYAGDGNDVIFGTAKNNWLYGGRGNDQLRAGPGSDRLFGGSGNDILRGEDGRDVISGGDGADLILGGRGDDKLSGGAGADRFQFEPGFGHDQITDFRDNQDSLILDQAIWGGGLSLDQVIATFAEIRGGMAVFDFGADEVQISNVASLALFHDDITLI